MKSNSKITIARAMELFNYSPETGILTWKIRQGLNVKIGDQAGSKRQRGGISVMADGRTYQVHHIIWLIEKGEYTKSNLMHIDGNVLNNKIGNLIPTPRFKNESDFVKNIEILKKIISYDKDTGVFKFLTKFGHSNAGDIAGYLTSHGYTVIFRVYAHRLAFLFMTGKFPDKFVDHIDGNKQNNSWVNLRDVSCAANVQNRKAIQPTNKSSGLLGVHLHKVSGKYCASIKTSGVKKYLGLFETPELAHEAYVIAKRKLHEGCTL